MDRLKITLPLYASNRLPKHTLKHRNIGCKTGRIANKNLEFGMCNVFVSAKVEACFFMIPWSLCDWRSESSFHERKHQFSSNSSQIDLSSETLVFLNERKSWMEWMADSIHYLTVIGSQKNPPEQLIFSWITVSLTDVYEEMIKSSFFRCIRNMIFLC